MNIERKVSLIGNLKIGLPFILSAPAGTGKTTLVQRLEKEFSSIKRNVSYTTRNPRVNEVNGVDYHFISEIEFQKMICDNHFLEHAKVFGNFYGTSKHELIKDLEKGFHVIMVIDTQGALQIKDEIKATSIFIHPPSYEELKNRLNSRSLDTIQSINTRLEWSKHEVKVASYYDFQIINDDLDTAYQVLKSIIIASEHMTLNIKTKG